MYLRSLVVAGFTGRRAEDVRRHVAELAQDGVPAPASVPTFYVLPPGLLTTADDIAVDGASTSGEAEPVLLWTSNGWYVAVGSDHTARDLEREDIELSKRACPKVLSCDALPLDKLTCRWDDLVLRSWVGAPGKLYQEGRLAELLKPRDVLEALRRRTGEACEGLVLFLGTVPLLGDGTVVTDTYKMQLATPDGQLSLEVSYRVRVREEIR